MRRRIAIAAALVGLAVLPAGLGVLPAGAIAEPSEIIYGTLRIRADGGFAPRVLPRGRYVPIRFQGYGDIDTTDGTLPPALQHVKLDFDRDGRLATAGLPACPPERLAETGPGRARELCRGAIVGSGHIEAEALVGGARVGLRSALTVFNGPRQGGNPTAVAHARAGFPIFETYVITVPIERRAGAYRYRASFDVPPIAGGRGSLTHIDGRLGRRWRFRGKERSYVSARCRDGILQTKGYLSFGGDMIIYGSLFKSCRNP